MIKLWWRARECAVFGRLAGVQWVMARLRMRATPLAA